MSKTRFLVVGCGSIGRRHIAVLKERHDVEVAACDPLPEALEAIRLIAPGAAVFDALGPALAWKPHIVIVAAPNSIHLEITRNSFAAGAHVLCEKPIADTVQDGRAMLDAAAEHGKLLAMAYSERYRPSIRYVQKMVKDGELGTLIGGRAMVGTYNTLLCAKTDYREHVHGALLFDYTHEFDFLRWMFGEVADVHCWGNNLGNKEKRCSPSLAVTTLRFESGAIASVHMDYVQHPQRRSLEVYGDRRVLELDLQTDVLKIFDSEEPTAHRTLRFDTERNNIFRAEHQDMLDAVLRGTPPAVSGLDGLKALEIAERASQQLLR